MASGQCLCGAARFFLGLNHDSFIAATSPYAAKKPGWAIILPRWSRRATFDGMKGMARSPVSSKPVGSLTKIRFTAVHYWPISTCRDGPQSTVAV